MHNNMHITQSSSLQSYLANSVPAVNTVTLSYNSTMRQMTEMSQRKKTGTK